ncbi:eukaryotic translation initiation factor 4E-binding protein 1 [Denticeps clupeoides]|uniref:Uncharacterized protein n=1 Tax=Denticeps clupeoides TaxID=299321 RepID=A0AAY4AYV9_9TELE|nr:eukaryotic translation initiation factor 4E-binding protein 2-like [Denticeps clupeoides]
MSVGSQKTSSQAIPTTRLVAVHDAAHMPHDYSSTPGGTLFSTTPGGTRIIYDRKFLLDCRSSPLARTPPTCLPNIPGVTSPPSSTAKDSGLPKKSLDNHNTTAEKSAGEDAQFEMDI